MALEDPTELHRNGTRRRITGIDGSGRGYTINADSVTEFPRGRRATAPLDVTPLPPHAGQYPGHVDRSVASMIVPQRPSLTLHAVRRTRPGHEIAALRLCMPDHAARGNRASRLA